VRALGDETGTMLPDDNSALAEGAQVAREVKASNDVEADKWSVEIKDGKRVVAEIPFKL
jgi:hypothetical protein